MVTLRDFINRLKRYNDWMWLNWGYNLVTSNLVADKLTVTEVAALTKTLNTQNNIPQTWVYTRQCWHTGNSVTKTSSKLDAKKIKKRNKNKNKNKHYQNGLRRMYRPQGTYPFLNKKLKDFSRTFKNTFPIFQGLHSVRKRAFNLCLFQFFQNMSNFILKVFPCLLLLVTWESGLDKVSTKFQGVSSTDYNFQELSRPWIFILKFNDF